MFDLDFNLTLTALQMLISEGREKTTRISVIVKNASVQFIQTKSESDRQMLPPSHPKNKVKNQGGWDRGKSWKIKVAGITVNKDPFLRH